MFLKVWEVVKAEIAVLDQMMLDQMMLAELMVQIGVEAEEHDIPTPSPPLFLFLGELGNVLDER